jgi:UDP-MurNAc hydroxylase
MIDLLEPHRVLFFAGPPCFLDPSLVQFNERSEASVFPDQLDIVRVMESERPDIAERTLFALPGEELTDHLLWSLNDLSALRMTPYTEKADYLAQYAERRRHLLDFDPGDLPAKEALEHYFRRMVTLSPYVSRRIDGEIEFVVQGRWQASRWTADFRERTVWPGPARDPLYVITLPASSLAAVLRDEATWDDIFLSLRVQFDEHTDRFVSHFKTLLRYMDVEMLRQLALYETALAQTDDMMTIETNGRRYEIPRRCPHAGSDLSRYGRINDDGTITCMAHRFCFDVRTGACLNASGYRMKVRPIDET